MHRYKSGKKSIDSRQILSTQILIHLYLHIQTYDVDCGENVYKYYTHVCIGIFATLCCNVC